MQMCVRVQHLWKVPSFPRMYRHAIMSNSTLISNSLQWDNDIGWLIYPRRIKSSVNFLMYFNGIQNHLQNSPNLSDMDKEYVKLRTTPGARNLQYQHKVITLSAQYMQLLWHFWRRRCQRCPGVPLTVKWMDTSSSPNVLSVSLAGGYLKSNPKSNLAVKSNSLKNSAAKLKGPKMGRGMVKRQGG